MAMIGRKGGNRTKRKKGKDYFSKIAALSHRKNNPNAKKRKYVGGRPPGSTDAGDNLQSIRVLAAADKLASLKRRTI